MFDDISLSKACFQPKEGGEPHTVSLHTAEGSGYDLSLFIDRKDTATGDSGWMLELGVNADGTIAGQITAHPGYDALATFTCSQDTLKVFGDSVTPPCIITDADDAPACDDAVAAMVAKHGYGEVLKSLARMAKDKQATAPNPIRDEEWRICSQFCNDAATIQGVQEVVEPEIEPAVGLDNTSAGLGAYVSPDDLGLPRIEFLRLVRDRITDDLEGKGHEPA